MTGAFSPKQPCANTERGFEFSRLHDEWMAAAYALVVPGRQASQRELTADVDGKSGLVAPQPCDHVTERRAG
jgi:hypothetical protein